MTAGPRTRAADRSARRRAAASSRLGAVTRGETQALVTVTPRHRPRQQIIDALTGEYRERFMLHYNMPPYATARTGRVGPPKRREIGHGASPSGRWSACCRRRRIRYSIRVVSEITESNGLHIDGLSLRRQPALMDAGVPSRRTWRGSRWA